MKRVLNRILLFLFLAAVVGAFIYAFQPQPLPVDFAEVVRGPMQVTIDEEGETRIRDRFLISAPVPGRVLRIDLEPGDRVLAGRTIVATFLPIEPNPLDIRTRAEAEARVRAAEINVNRVRANVERVRQELAFAESQLSRYEELFEQGLVSRERLEAAEFEARRQREAFNTAELEIPEVEQAIEVARASLLEAAGNLSAQDTGRPITIRSPIDGVVLRRFRESEAVVPSGDPLVEVGNTSEIEIVSDLLSADAVRVAPGYRVLIEQWGGGMTLEGRVRRIEPSGFTKLSALGVEEQRVNVLIDFHAPDEAAGSLGDGYRVEVRIVVWETAETLKIPTSALFRTGEDWSVFSVNEGRSVLRRIEIGRRNGLEAEILSGLSLGDTVIVHPSGDVADGVAIVPR